MVQENPIATVELDRSTPIATPIPTEACIKKFAEIALAKLKKSSAVAIEEAQTGSAINHFISVEIEPTINVSQILTRALLNPAKLTQSDVEQIYHVLESPWNLLMEALENTNQTRIAYARLIDEDYDISNKWYAEKIMQNLYACQAGLAAFQEKHDFTPAENTPEGEKAAFYCFTNQNDRSSVAIKDETGNFKDVTQLPCQCFSKNGTSLETLADVKLKQESLLGKTCWIAKKGQDKFILDPSTREPITDNTGALVCIGDVQAVPGASTESYFSQSPDSDQPCLLVAGFHRLSVQGKEIVAFDQEIKIWGEIYFLLTDENGLHWLFDQNLKVQLDNEDNPIYIPQENPVVSLGNHQVLKAQSSSGFDYRLYQPGFKRWVIEGEELRRLEGQPVVLFGEVHTKGVTQSGELQAVGHNNLSTSKLERFVRAIAGESFHLYGKNLQPIESNPGQYSFLVKSATEYSCLKTSNTSQIISKIEWVVNRVSNYKVATLENGREIIINNKFEDCGPVSKENLKKARRGKLQPAS